MSLQIPFAGSGIERDPVDVSETVFGREFNETLVHQLIVAYMASARSGTKAQKSRSDVSGGGAKPWRQKGTGRARAGSTRSPLWRTGGVTFAAENRSFKQKLNKKMYRAAMRSIFSQLLREGRLMVTDGIILAEPKTRLLVETLRPLGIEKGLLVTEQNPDRNLLLAARNIAGFEIAQCHALSPVALVGSEKIVLTVDAVRRIEATLS